MCPSFKVPARKSPRRVRIIGLGNPLRGDDGVGPALVARLETVPLPAAVEVVDGGTGGLTLLGLLDGADGAVLVDAAELGRPPGSVVRVPCGELDRVAEDAACSPHYLGVGDVLALGCELGVIPELVLFLVQPETLHLEIGLSRMVDETLPRLADLVLQEASRMSS